MVSRLKYISHIYEDNDYILLRNSQSVLRRTRYYYDKKTRNLILIRIDNEGIIVESDNKSVSSYEMTAVPKKVLVLFGLMT